MGPSRNGQTHASPGAHARFMAAAGGGPGAKTATAGPKFDSYVGMILHASMLRKIAPASFALLLTACPDKSGGTDSDSQGSESGSGGSSTTAVEPTSGGSVDSGTTAGGATEGGATEGMSGTTTEAGPTTGGDAPELMSSCMDACAHIIECVPGLPGPIEDCMAGCLETWGGPECGQTGVDFLQCLIGMNCKQLQAYVEQDKAGVCAGAAEAAEAVCDGGSSTCVMGGGAGMGECSVSRECDGTVEELQCNGELCTCVVDGVPGESCKDAGVCPMDLDGQIFAAETCCGWVWS